MCASAGARSRSSPRGHGTWAWPRRSTSPFPRRAASSWRSSTPTSSSSRTGSSSWSPRSIATPRRPPSTGKTRNYWRREEHRRRRRRLHDARRRPDRRGIGAPDRGQYESRGGGVRRELPAPPSTARRRSPTLGRSMSPSTPISRTSTGACARSSRGYRAWYVPGAVAYHMGGATMGGEKPGRYGPPLPAQHRSMCSRRTAAAHASCATSADRSSPCGGLAGRRTPRRGPRAPAGLVAGAPDAAGSRCASAGRSRRAAA